MQAPEAIRNLSAIRHITERVPLPFVVPRYASNKMVPITWKVGADPLQRH